MTAKRDHELDKLKTHARFLNSKFPKLSVLLPYTSDYENSAIYFLEKKSARLLDCLFSFFSKVYSATIVTSTLSETLSST